MREAWCLKSIVLLGVIALALGTPFVPTAEATADPWTILVTTTLTEEHFGEIIIGADNITLDGGGNFITGTGAGSGTGILVSGRTGVTIQNCKVRDFDNCIIVQGGGGGHTEQNDGLEAPGRSVTRSLIRLLVTRRRSKSCEKPGASSPSFCSVSSRSP